jgi:branched-chain amino acid transport system ATP-binding protein
MTSALFGRAPGISMREARALAEKFCELTGIGEKKNAFPKSLTVADQKRIEIARALAVNPRMLLLDEVMSGLTPAETNEAIKLVRKLRESGITILLIEHVMKVVMDISDRVIVLHHGEKIAEGSTMEVANNRQVIEAYLGEKTEV